MKTWKIMVGAIAIMWGTKAECAQMQREVKTEGGKCHIAQCTQSDIDAICNR